MTFLDEAPDLSRTLYGELDLLAARAHLVATIRRVDPSWLDSPYGVLGRHWIPPRGGGGRGPDPFHWCFLIGISRIVAKVEASSTPRSRTALDSKLRALLHTKDSHKFEEVLYEIELADVLACGGYTLDFEPLVDEGRRDKGQTPRSPDFYVIRGGLRAYCEATIFRYGRMDRRARCIAAFGERLRLRLKPSGQFRTLIATVPLDVGEFNEAAARAVVNKIAAEPSGQWRGILGGREVDLVWRSTRGAFPPDATEVLVGAMDVFDTGRTEEIGGIGGVDTPKVFWGRTPDGTVGLLGGLGTHGVAINFRLPPGSDPGLEDSLRRKLKKKGEQFTADGPYVLALKWGDPFPSHLRLLADAAWSVLRGGREFRWISEVWLFSPRMGYSPRDAPGAFFRLANPHATHPLGDDVSAGQVGPRDK